MAERLALDKHDVSIVESDEEVAARLSEKIDAMIIQGNAGSPNVLEQAGIRESEMVISVSDSDELNMIVCLLARNYGVKTRIARIRNPEYAGSKAHISRQQLAIDRIINPEEIAVDHMEELIFTAGATEVADFAEHKVRLMGFLVPDNAPILGHSLQEMREIWPDAFLIVAIHRGQEVIVPRGSDQIKAHDRIYVLMPRELVDLFLGQLYRRLEKINKIVIHGASRMGVSLAQRLESRVSDITLIEADHSSCVKAAATLNRTTVLHGSALDPDLLAEVRVGHVQVFCALTDDDASNVMSALLAKDLGARRTMVSLGEPDFIPIVERIGVDSATNPRLLAVDVIMRFVRGGNIKSIVHLQELKAEVMEMIPAAGSAVINRTLSELAPILPEGALIGVIIRDHSMIIPTGKTVLLPGEHVIVFAAEKARPRIEKLFTKPQ